MSKIKAMGFVDGWVGGICLAQGFKMIGHPRYLYEVAIGVFLLLFAFTLVLIWQRRDRQIEIDNEKAKLEELQNLIGGTKIRTN